MLKSADSSIYPGAFLFRPKQLFGDFDTVSTQLLGLIQCPVNTFQQGKAGISAGEFRHPETRG